MTQENVESTQPNYSEQWGVAIGKEIFILNEDEIKILKQASTSGNRRLVWFSKFAISIPHIQAVYLISKKIKDLLPAGEKVEITPEARMKARKQIEKIRKKFEFINKSP